jgi:peptidoglycan/xylan/chitin deacetylase (PgdA/CDA1 family)
LVANREARKLFSVAKTRLRESAKFLAFSALGNEPWLRHRLERVRDAGVATILNLHRVGPNDRSAYPPLAPALFESLLSFVTREFSVVTIGELPEPASKPKLVLSFDDGYRDFIIFAVPLMKRYGVRANQNIIPKCIETGRPPLNVVAQDFVGQAPAELTNRLRIDGFNGPRDQSFGNKLSHFLKMRSQAEQDRIADDLLPQFFAWEEFEPTAVMTLDEVRSLNGHELGGHSYCHSSMEFETDEYLEDDVQLCGSFFRDKLDRQMTIYAFPNGSYRPGQPERVRSFGVEHVLLVGEDFDRGAHVHKRFTFFARSPSEVRFKSLGSLAGL